MRAGLPGHRHRLTINRFCSSGLQAIALAADRIRSGGAEIIIAGGSESMSMIPRGGHKPAPNPWFVDNRPEVYMNMGLTAERLQKKYGISREDQTRSRCAAIRMRCVPRRGPLRRRDRACGGRNASLNGPSRRSRKQSSRRMKGRARDTSLEALAKLKPVFHAKGTVTAGNSSQTSDGAAAALVMSEKKARELGLKPMARFVSFAAGGVPPEIMGIGPVVAIPKALALAGLKLDDIDVIELNEAFAVQALAVIRESGPRSRNASMSMAAPSRWDIRWAAPAPS